MPAPGTLHLRTGDTDLAPVLAQALAAAPAAVVLMDHDANVVGVNDAHRHLTGVPAEGVLGPHPVNVREVLRRVRPDLVADLDRALLGEVVDLPEFFLQIPVLEHGRPPSERLARGFWIWARAWPVRDAAGAVRLVAILFDDVTERRELEAMLVQAQKSESISTMAAGLAHDVNNILSGVVGYASLLASRLPRGSTDHDAAMTILDSADRAAHLASQLMIVSRRSATQLQPMDPGEVLPRIASLLARTLGAEHPLRIDVAPDLLAVDADRPQIEQALANLCANARDAMPDGGPIVVRARNRRFDPGERRPLANMPAGEYVQIDVIDQGVGMTPEVAARIFEPFFTTKPMGPGVGLGLAVVHGIVKSHRGFIVVASRSGQGSVFSVFLPRSRTMAAPAAEPERVSPAPQQPASGPLSVLVIDDEPIVRRVLSEMLVRLGHQAVAVEGSDPAMDLLMRDRSRFDALIVDVFLPERSGLDLVEALRAAHFDLPVLVCTGYSSPEVQARVAALPGTMILPKPFNVDVLREALGRALAGSTGN